MKSLKKLKGTYCFRFEGFQIEKRAFAGRNMTTMTVVGKWAGGETPHGRVDFVNGTDFHAQPISPLLSSFSETILD